MYNKQHYISKINKNTSVLDKVTKNSKVKCAQNIKWTKSLSKRLQNLDYEKKKK